MTDNNARPHFLLPHAFPFVMLDEVCGIERGRMGMGRKLIPSDDALGRGAVFPAVFLLEAAAQLSGMVSGREEGGFFAGIKDVSFSRQVVPGDVVEIESVMKGAFGGLFSFIVTARCDGELVMEGEIYLALA